MANCRPIPCENFFEFVGIKDNLPKLKQVKFLLCTYSHVVEKKCFDFTQFLPGQKKKLSIIKIGVFHNFISTFALNPCPFHKEIHPIS